MDVLDINGKPANSRALYIKNYSKFYNLKYTNKYDKTLKYLYPFFMLLLLIK